MERRRRGERPRCAWFSSWAWLVMALWACAPEQPAASTVLQLQPQGQAPEATSVIVWSASPSAERGAWTITAASEQTVQTERGLALKLGGGASGEPVLMSRSGSWSLGGFDQLRLTGMANDKTRVQVAFRREGRLLGSSAPVPMAHGASAGVTLIDLPVALSQAGQALTLALLFDGRPEGVVVERLELLRRPAAGLVPDPAEPPALVFLDGVARRGLGLVAGRPLKAAALVPEGGRLSFAVGRPAASSPDSLVLVRCEGQSSGQVIERRVAPPRARVTDAGREQGWQPAVIDLAELGGEQVSLTWQLVAAEGHEQRAAAIVAEAEILAGDELQAAVARRVVLLVTSDTHRGDHLGAARDGVAVSTPRLDGLAQRGLMFEQCFTSTNFTNPSHVALMTAVHPRDTGILDNGHALHESAETLAEVFAAEGWETWAVTSAAHLRPSVSGLGQGFARFARTRAVQRRAGEAVDQVLAWLDEGGTRPLFVWLHLFDAHMPYESPEPFDRLGYSGPDDPFDPALPAPDLDQPLPGNMAGLRVLEFGRSQYAAQVSYLDHELGRLLDHPELRQGTVAVVGDHGEVLGAHDIWFDHAELYSDTLHVPLLLSWPDAPPGVRRTERVSHLDLGRTLLDLAGLGSREFPGRDLTTISRPQPLFALSSHGTSASITSGSSHLILHLMGHNRRYAAHQLELFDLADDPGCTDDLVDAHPERVGPLAEQLVSWLSARRELGWRGEAVVDEQTLQGLAELGYVEAPGDRGGEPLFEADDCSWCVRWR